MLVIRLLRIGKKNQPFFKIVVIDKRKSARAGRFVEEVGFLNPLKKEKTLKQERIKYWLSVGAKPSDTIYNMLISEKIIEGKKIAVHKKPKKKEEKAPEAPTVAKPTEPSSVKTTEGKEKPVAPEKPVEEKPKEETPKEEKKEEEKE